MSVSSLVTGASGITAHSKAMAVVGDNIANSNTIGFKKSRANFEDVLARSIGSGTGDGMGARVSDVQRMLTQGALLGTGVATDLAINGDGFFMAKGNSQGLQSTFYTRAGQFKIDKDGNIVTQQGLNVQGYNADVTTGNVVKQVTDLKIPTVELPPQPTTTAEIAGNLSANATTPTGAWDVTDATNTSNFSTSVTVHDSLGNAHAVTIYFRNDSSTATSTTWSWHGAVDGGEIASGTAGTPVEIGTGNLVFDNQGRLQSGSPATITVNSPDNFSGAADQTVSVDFGDATGSGGTGLRGMTQYAAQSSVTFVDQNGASSGALSGISIGEDGQITGIFSNGKQRTVGQVLLADFQNSQDLQAVGNSLFIETIKSGPAAVGAPGNGGRGAVKAGSLEQSNVDLAEEFINLIAYQRGFQASSRTVTTADQVMQETVNLKR